MTAVRPPVPNWDPPKDHEWRVVPDDGPLRWRLVTIQEGATRKCRHSTRQRCLNAPVAALVRGRRAVTYFYCADHMYGRWIEDGRVVSWVIRRVGS